MSMHFRSTPQYSSKSNDCSRNYGNQQQVASWTKSTNNQSQGANIFRLNKLTKHPIRLEAISISSREVKRAGFSGLIKVID